MTTPLLHFVKTLKAAALDGRMTASAYRVLVVIGDAIDRKTDAAMLTYDMIAERTGMDRRNISTPVKLLAEIGYIEIKPGGAHRASRYRLPARFAMPDHGKEAEALPCETMAKRPDVAMPDHGKFAMPHNGSSCSSSLTKAKAKDRSLSAQISFIAFLQRCKDAGEQPMPGDDPIMDWAADAGIPKPYLRLAWREFSERYRAAPEKTQAGIKGWRALFRNAVRSNWFRLWYVDEQTGKIGLTTAGKTHQRALDKTGKQAKPEFQTV